MAKAAGTGGGGGARSGGCGGAGSGARRQWRKKSAERTGGVALLDLLGFAFHDYFNSPFTFLPPAFSFISFSFLLSNSLSPLSLYLSLSLLKTSSAVAEQFRRAATVSVSSLYTVWSMFFSSPSPPFCWKTTAGCVGLDAMFAGKSKA